MSTWAKPSSSIQFVGGVQPRPDGPYSRSVAVLSSWRSTAEVVVELVVLLGAGGHVAERVAQLVEQRHVLDRSPLAPTTTW